MEDREPDLPSWVFAVPPSRADYALGMELKKRGYKATYLQQNLAEGEAPEEIRQARGSRGGGEGPHLGFRF